MKCKISIFLIFVSVLCIPSCNSTGNESDKLNIIPRPLDIRVLDDTHKFGERTLEEVIDDASFDISERYGEELGTEGYRLEVDHDGIRIHASGERGVFYAKETLKQMTVGKSIQCARITDIPRFPYRGIHIDVSRHFFDKEEIKKIIDEMARYKFNALHFHLTDNGGWRLQSEKYPDLTRKGAFRTQKDWYNWFDCKDRRFVDEGTPGAYGGYYTKEDMRELINYAQERMITIIPEIEFPAHSDAVFVAYPELCCTGRAYTTGEYCAGNEKVYEFMEDILDEVIELFPSDYIHIGGDEAKRLAWKECPRCQSLIKKENMNSILDIQPYMIKRIEKYLNSKSKVLIGWDEILHGSLDSSTIVMSYRGQKGGIEAANRGIRTIMTPGEVLYFDWYQDDPETEPRAMYGYSPIKKMYEFEPLPISIETAAHNEDLIQGKPVPRKDIDYIKEDNSDKMIGIQGCMWTEYIESEEHLEYMIFPRILAVSEIGWTQPHKKDWNDFKRRLSEHLPEMKSRGINTFDRSKIIEITSYMNPLKNTSKVTLDSEIWGGTIKFTTDGTDPTPESCTYIEPFEVEDSTTIKACLISEGNKIGKISKKLIRSDCDQKNYYTFEPPQIWKDFFEKE